MIQGSSDKTPETSRPFSRVGLAYGFGVAVAISVIACTSACHDDSGFRAPLANGPLIILDIDTLRADHLGCYGYERNTSPFIDRFASESVVFEWAFSQAPNTPPSQATILSGLYPSTHGMIEDDDRLPHDVRTLAEVLRDNGYVTAGFHDGGYLSNTFQMGQGFDTYEGFGGQGLKAIGPEVVGWLHQHANEKFLLFVHTYDTHTPYAPVSPFDQLFMDGVPSPTPGFIPNPEQMEAIRLSKYTDNPRMLPDNDIAYAMALYDGEIRFVDDWVEKFMAVLRELGLDEIATVVILSDHGEEFQEHGSVLHEKLYRTVTHIPLILRFPNGTVQARIERPVGAIDVMPTLLNLCGLPVPDAVQGYSLLPLLASESSGNARSVFSESPFFGHRRGVVWGNLHLLHTISDGKIELYDYRLDPDEQDDLAAQHASQISTMLESLEQWRVMVEADAINAQANDAQMDEETKEQLRELGYIR
jgi:arylsulfatase A-like enzyme